MASADQSQTSSWQALADAAKPTLNNIQTMRTLTEKGNIDQLERGIDMGIKLFEDIAKLEPEYAKLLGEHDSRADRVRTMQEQQTTLATQLQIEEHRFRALRDDLSSMEQDKSRLQQEIDNLDDSLTTKQEELASLESNLRDLNVRSIDVVEREARNQEEEQSLRKQRLSLMMLRAISSANVQSLGAKQLALLKDQDSLKAAQDSLRSQQESLEADQQACAKQVHEFQQRDEQITAQSQNNVLLQQLLEEASDRVKTTFFQLRESTERQRSMETEVIARRTKLVRANDALYSVLGFPTFRTDDIGDSDCELDTEELVESIRKELNGLRLQNESLRQNVESLDSRLEINRSRQDTTTTPDPQSLERTQSKVTELEKEVKQLKDTLSTTATQLQQQQQLAEELKDTVTAADKDLQQQKGLLDECERLKEEYRTLLQRETSKSGGEREANVVLKEDLRQKKRKLNDLQREVHSKTTLVNTLTAEKDKALKVNQDLEENIDALRSVTDESSDLRIRLARSEVSFAEKLRSRQLAEQQQLRDADGRLQSLTQENEKLQRLLDESNERFNAANARELEVDQKIREFELSKQQHERYFQNARRIIDLDKARGEQGSRARIPAATDQDGCVEHQRRR